MYACIQYTAIKKNFRHFRKTLAETVHYIPKVLRKGNPFHGPFAQLSYVCTHYRSQGTYQSASHHYPPTFPSSEVTNRHSNLWFIFFLGISNQQKPNNQIHLPSLSKSQISHHFNEWHALDLSKFQWSQESHPSPEAQPVSLVVKFGCGRP